MPSGANSLQLHTKYASVNRGTIHYGGGIGRGRHHEPETWSEANDIDLDRLFTNERAYIDRMRHWARADNKETEAIPTLRLVYETLGDISVSGEPVGTYRIAKQLNMSRDRAYKEIKKLENLGLVERAGSRRSGFRMTGKEPYWTKGHAN